MKNSIIISTIIGLILAFIIMSIAWEHNPQYETHNGEIIHFKYWITIGFSWFILAFIVVFSLMTIAKKITNKRTDK